MHFLKTIPFAAALLTLQAQLPTTLPPGPTGSVPLYKLTVVQGSAKAINYRNLKSSTKIDLKGTALCPKAEGIAKVETERGAIHIIAKVKHLEPASTLGDAYLTYVLWGISPEGRATNLGELVAKKGKGKLEVTESLQTFGLVLTAEPYFAVSQPSDAVVMENVVGKDAMAQVEAIDAKYELLKRGQYTLNLAASTALPADDQTPMDLCQARNAVRIARAAGASSYAGEGFGKAENYLKQAEATPEEKERVMLARECIQRAEDARLVSVQRQDAERIAMEHKLVQDKLDEAKREAALEAAAKETALRQAKLTEMENEGLRTQLMDQLNAILKTRASARGLIVNMNGVLFQTGKATLAPEAREKLAKIAGILATHKGLKIEADGFTDSTGSEAFNRQLSEKRAMMARDFLVSQGVPPDSIVFKGMGEASPIASNDTDEGRQENRRVELVVSGEGVTPVEP